MNGVLNLQGHRRHLLLAALLSALTYGCGIALLGLSAWLISRAAEHPSPSSLALAAVGVRALGLSRGVCRYAERVVGHDVTLRLVADLRVRVFQSLVHRRDDETRRGELLSSVVTDVDAVQDLWLRCLIPAASALLVSLGCVAACLWWSTAAALVLLLGLATAGLVLPALAAGLARHDRGLADRRAAYVVQVLDVVQGCPDLLVSGAMPEALDRARSSADGLAREDRRAAARTALPSALLALVQGATTLGVLAVALAEVQDGRLPRVGLAVLVLVALAAFEPMAPVLDGGALAPRILNAVRRLARLVETTAPPAVPEPELSDTVVLRGVRVRYPRRTAWALDGLSLDLEPGRCVAVVGPSGAGKSTLLKVLTGALAPASGSALLGGATISSLTDQQLSRHLVLAEQEAYLFNASVRDNLLLAKPDATTEELVDALEVVGLGAWLAALPRGMDTPVGERGTMVSGGERKRLSVARVLLCPARFVLLDEPTEGLDGDEADTLVHRLLDAFRDRGVLLVTHRPAALEGRADVLVLDGGQGHLDPGRSALLR